MLSGEQTNGGCPNPFRVLCERVGKFRNRRAQSLGPKANDKFQRVNIFSAIGLAGKHSNHLQIRSLVFHALTCTNFAVRARLSPLFDVFRRIRIPPSPPVL
jgi:hypothetical protein